MRIEIVSEDSCLITLGSDINPQISENVRQLVTQVHQHFGDAVIDVVPSYCSILLNLDVLKITTEECCNELAKLIEGAVDSIQTQPAQRIEIPCYYGEEFGLDLAELSQRLDLSQKEIIRLHSHSKYRVYAIGFAPGFCFLGSLPERLRLPRKPSPRPKLASGSVAIAELQTAVYPCSTPGGWHLIGRTPIDMLNLCTRRENPLQVGDEIHFKPITRSDYFDLGGESS